ncbi:MAG: hypothetical protein KOO66_08790, partial [Bacteroidales bacterium]|nr:hypothetical protein [Bacteroidales bacterium]
MKKVFSLIIILIPVISFSQNSSIKDIKLDVKNNYDIIVNYNITNKQDSIHHVDFMLIDDSKNVYFPENSVGSVGNN